MALLTLAEAKTALNITATTYDAELQDYIDGAIAAVEFICGPSSSTNATEVLQGCGALVLTHRPVLSLISVTGDLVGARDLTYIRFDADSGVVRANARSIPLLADWYTVVYTYGRASVPVAMKQAAKAIVKQQWQLQRGPTAKQQSPDSTLVPGYGYVMNEALQMLAPYALGPASG